MTILNCNFNFIIFVILPFCALRKYIRKDSVDGLGLAASAQANEREKRNGSSEIGQRIVIVVVIVDKQCDLISIFFFIRSDCVCACFLRSANVMRAVSATHCTDNVAMIFLDSINVKYVFINLFILKS